MNNEVKIIPIPLARPEDNKTILLPIAEPNSIETILLNDSWDDTIFQIENDINNNDSDSWDDIIFQIENDL